MSEAPFEFASCGACRWRQGEECRRRAPDQAADTGKAVWPLVALNEWCGEYRRDPQKERVTIPPA